MGVGDGAGAGAGAGLGAGAGAGAGAGVGAGLGAQPIIRLNIMINTAGISQILAFNCFPPFWTRLFFFQTTRAYLKKPLHNSYSPSPGKQRPSVIGLILVLQKGCNKHRFSTLAHAGTLMRFFYKTPSSRSSAC